MVGRMVGRLTGTVERYDSSSPASEASVRSSRQWYIPLAVGRNLPTCVPLLVPLLPPLIIDSPFREDSKRNLI